MEDKIKYLTSNGNEPLRCPRCGWKKGGFFHCGLCEGHEENIINFYKSLFKSQLKELRLKIKGIDEHHFSNIDEDFVSKRDVLSLLDQIEGEKKGEN